MGAFLIILIGTSSSTDSDKPMTAEMDKDAVKYRHASNRSIYLSLQKKGPPYGQVRDILRH